MDSSQMHKFPFMGLSPLKSSNQGFCIRVKPEFSPTSSVGFPQETSFGYDDEEQNYSFNELDLDFDCFDTFNDVILQENNSFDGMQLDCPTTSSPSEYNGSHMDIVDSFAKQPSEFSDVKFSPFEMAHTDLDEYLNPLTTTLSLPDVKQAESCQNLIDNEVSLEDSCTLHIESQMQTVPKITTIKLKTFKSNKRQKKGHIEPVVLKEKSTPADCQQVPDARMTLKEVLNMDNANIILDRLFEPDSSDVESSDEFSTCSSIQSSKYSISSVMSERSVSQELVNKCRGRDRAEKSEKDRYAKKKEQNKQAALRYRMKKRQCDDELQKILINEEQKQKELKKTLINLKREVNFMKKLMREAFIIKGLVAADAFKKSTTEK